MKVFVVAGEASGDVLGAQVLDGLKSRFGEKLEIEGLGGERMAAQGLTSIFPMNDVAVMGLVEVLRRYRFLMKRLNLLKQAIEKFHPDVLLMIDAQGLSFRLGKYFANAPFKKVQLVAPTVWAWKPERAAKVARFLDHILCLFPFEPPFFETAGILATYVGHPAPELKKGLSRSVARDKLGIDGTWVAVLPGSRRTETSSLCPVFGRIVKTAYAKRQISGILVPVVSSVAKQVRDWAGSLELPFMLLESDEERANLPAADLALAASGTVSLELSAQGIPAILAYRFHPLTYVYVRSRLAVNFMSLINLMAGKEIQPEFKLNEVREADLAACFAELATSPEQRLQIVEEQFSALQGLQIDDGNSFGKRVAALIDP